MIVATALVVIRTLIVIWLAARFRREPVVNFAGADQRSDRGIQRRESDREHTCVRCLATDYEGELEVIVVDDGSSDRTAAEVERIAAEDSRVRLLRQENHGKARALQRALAAVRHEIVVFLDADTHCQRDTLRKLVRPFADCARSAPFPVTPKSAICAVSSRAVRRSNTPADSISIDAPTHVGIASRLCPARSARFANRRSMKSAG